MLRRLTNCRIIIIIIIIIIITPRALQAKYLEAGKRGFAGEP